MKNSKIRVLSIVMAMSMIPAVLSGCTEKSDDSSSSSAASADTTAQTTKAASGEKKTITISIMDRGKCPAEEGTMEENRWTKWINENSPVNVKWVVVPRTESVVKINALFAAGEAPDLVWEYGKSFMDNLYGQGVLQPVDEYVEKYSTEYKAYLEKNSNLKPFVTADDGQMYGFTSSRTEMGIANHGMWIRQDWLDKLGLKTPTTIDELYDVANQFATKDPDGNGQNDTVGLTFNYNFTGIAKALFGQPSDGVVVDNKGTVSDWTGSQAYADCFSMLRNMYSNKIIDAEYITDTKFERQRQLLVTGKAGIYFGSYDTGTEWKELKTNVPEANLVPLEPTESKYGKQGLYQEPAAFRMVCMNKDAKDPEACIQYLDWMLSTGWKTLTNGIEGENYKLVDGVAKPIDAAVNTTKLSYAYEYPTLMDQVIEDTDKYIEVNAADDELSQQYAKARALSLKTAMKNVFTRNVPYLMSSDASSQFNTDFGTILTSIEAKMITDSSYTVEDGIKEIASQKDVLGFKTVLEERQEWYDKNKDSFKK